MSINSQSLVKINTQEDVTVKPGQLLTYKYALRHKSGINAGCIIDNLDVVALVDDHVTHYNPVRNSSGETDNEKSHCSFLFKAIAKGKAHIIIKHEWQGNVHKTHKVVVNVV